MPHATHATHRNWLIADDLREHLSWLGVRAEVRYAADCLIVTTNEPDRVPRVFRGVQVRVYLED